VGNRVVKTYYGRGPAGRAAAQEDEAKQARRLEQQLAAEIEKAMEKPTRALMAELDQGVKVAIHTALIAAGFRQHCRGSWRRKRRAKANEEPR
jgi:hypothetical protein